MRRKHRNTHTMSHLVSRVSSTERMALMAQVTKWMLYLTLSKSAFKPSSMHSVSQKIEMIGRAETAPEVPGDGGAYPPLCNARWAFSWGPVIRA